MEIVPTTSRIEFQIIPTLFQFISLIIHQIIFIVTHQIYYGFLEESEGIWFESSLGDHTLDVGVEGIPSKNLNDSKGYVDKLIRYSSQDQLKVQWKKNIYLVADDGDNNVHKMMPKIIFNYWTEREEIMMLKKYT